MSPTTGFGTANGTFGELLQGMLPDGRRFLVTLPLDAWAHATFRPTAAATVSVHPPGKTKAKQLATRMLRAYGHDGGILELTGRIPEGKGLASSSADLVATARAVADALAVPLDEETTERFLRGIEPSDGVMYAGVVSYYHRQVRLRERLGFLPALTVVAHDSGGTVDTVRFNRTAPAPDRRTRREYAVLLDALSTAVRVRDLDTAGQIATRSAELHLGPVPGLRFERMRKICREVGGLGLAVAHSGTYLGILIDGRTDPAGHRERVERARAQCAELPGAITVFRTCDEPSSTVRRTGLAGGDYAL
jgi:L-threonine kinase